MTDVPVSTPTRSRSVREQTYRLLRRQLVTGQFCPGQRLTEQFLAQRLGVSRTPIREALHKLELEGLVIAAGARGFQVPDDSVEDMNELFEIRAVLEGHALACLSRTIAAEALIELRVLVDQGEHACEAGNLERVFALNTRFHDLLYALSKSPRLIKMINDLKDQIFRFRQLILKDETMARTSNEDHILMLEYIRRRDGEGVEKLVREHLMRGQKAVMKHLHSQG